MDVAQNFFSEAFMHALGWTVLHSLWQAVVIAALLGVVLQLGKNMKSSYKYAIANFALLGCLIAPVATFIYLYDPVSATTSPMDTMTEVVIMMTGQAEGFATGIQHYLPVVVNIWFVGFVILLFRMFGGLYLLRRLRIGSTDVTNEAFRNTFETVYQKSGLRKQVRLLQSIKVSSPVVIGYFKPVVIVPVSMINNLSYEQAEAILAHELAHVLRNDYILNLIQSFIEAALYFNPAVWWISSQVRSLREHCCDDIAVQMIGNDPFAYARSLVLVQELAHTGMANKLAMSFSGTSGKMLDRVKHILHQPQKNVFAMEKLLFSGLLLIVFLTASAFNHAKDEPKSENLYSVTLNETAGSYYTALDSVPENRRVVEERVTISENGKEYKATYKDGKMTSLSVNGETISEAEYDRYTKTIQALRREVQPVSPDEDEIIELKKSITLTTNDDGGERTFKIRVGDDEEIIVLDGDDLSIGQNRFMFFSDDEDGSKVFDVEKSGDHHVIRLEGDKIEWNEGTLKIMGEDGEMEIIEIPNFHFNWNDGEGEELRFFSPDGQGQSFQFDLDIDDEEMHEHLAKIKGYVAKEMESFDEEEIQELIHESMEKSKKALKGYKYYIQEMQDENGNRKIDVEIKRELERAQQDVERAQREMERSRGEMQIQMREAERNLRENEREQLRVQRQMEREKMREQDVVRGYFQAVDEEDGNRRIVVAPRMGFRGDFESLVENEMLNDGLIESAEDYTLKLQEGKMKVNGKRQSQEIYEKYKELWERNTGTDIGGTKLSLNKKS